MASQMSVTPSAGHDRRDPFAVASLAVALVGLLGFLAVHLAFALVSPVAAVLGVIAVRRIGIVGAPGRGLAMAGFLVGGVGTVLCIFLLVGTAVAANAQAAGL